MSAVLVARVAERGARDPFTELLGRRRGTGIRMLLQQGKKFELGAVVFIDELDAVGAKRSSGESNSGAREADKTMNASQDEPESG